MENTRKKEIHINKNEIKEILGNIYKTSIF